MSRLTDALTAQVANGLAASQQSKAAALLETVERASASSILLVKAGRACATGGSAAPMVGAPRVAGGLL